MSTWALAPVLNLIKTQHKDKYTLPTLERRKYEDLCRYPYYKQVYHPLGDSKLCNIVFLLKKVKKAILLKYNIGISRLLSLHIIILVTNLGYIFYFKLYVSMQRLFNDYNDYNGII